VLERVVDEIGIEKGVVGAHDAEAYPLHVRDEVECQREMEEEELRGIGALGVFGEVKR
jgi:hypothetical protein